MADEVIDSLLVKLGLDTDDKSFANGKQMFNGLKSTALQFGAIIGTGLGAKDLTFGFAKTTEELGRFAKQFSTTPEYVDALGYALGQVGGDASEAFSSIQKMANLIEDTEWGQISSEAFKVAGFDPYVLQGVTSIAEAYERLAEATKDLDPEAQRRALSALGFGQTEISLITGDGGEKLKTLIAEGMSFGAVTKDMTDQGIAFNESIGKLTKAADAIANAFSAIVLDDLTDVINDLADYLKGNKGGIAQYMADYSKVATSPIDSTTDLIKDAWGLLKYNVQKDRDQQELQRQNLSRAPDLIDLNDPATSDAMFEKMMGGKPEPMLIDLNDPTTSDAMFEQMMGNEGITINNEITVDARGATNPQETEQAVIRGVEKVVNRMSENTINDIRGNIK